MTMNSTVVEKGAPAVPATSVGSRLFKAVATDGTDFHTGTVPWLPADGAPIPEGGWLVEHPEPGQVGSANPSGFLSASSVETDCTGFSWPARLLLVEPAATMWTPNPDLLPDKRAARAWRAVRELPAWQLLGPQGREVAALIEQVSHLTSAQIEGLAAARGAVFGAVLGAAWDAFQPAARDAALAAALNASLNASRVAAMYAAQVAAAQGAAAQDAVYGLLVKDLISVEDFRTLTDPWEQVMGPIEVPA